MNQLLADSRVRGLGFYSTVSLVRGPALSGCGGVNSSSAVLNPEVSWLCWLPTYCVSQLPVTTREKHMYWLMAGCVKMRKVEYTVGVWYPSLYSRLS